MPLNLHSLTNLLPSLLLLLSLSLHLTHSSAQQTPTSIFIMPTPTDGATWPSSNGDGNSDDDDSSNEVSNYYYLLIAVFAVIVIISTWAFIRRRRLMAQHLAEHRGGRYYPGGYGPGGPPSPAGRRAGYSRWRMLGLEQRVEEGLNEQGEAPPPYMPGQALPAAHTMNGAAGGDGIALQTFVGKPPEYHADSEEEDLGMARPAPVHAHEREGARRPLVSSARASSDSRSSEMSGGGQGATSAAAAAGKASHDTTGKETAASPSYDHPDDHGFLTTPTGTNTDSGEASSRPAATGSKEMHG